MPSSWTGGSIETVNRLEYAEELVILGRVANPEIYRHPLCGPSGSTRSRAGAGEAGERVGLFLGSIARRLSGKGVVTTPMQSGPAPDSADSEPNPIPSDSRQVRQPVESRTRNWILAFEVMEILAHVPPFRSVRHRFLGPRGADPLFLGTSLAGLLLPFHASRSVDVVALCMVAARFALGFLIEPWWIDLLFGVTGIAMFIIELRRHRRALAAG